MKNSKYLVCGLMLVGMLFPTLTVKGQIGEYRNEIAVGANMGLNFNTIAFDPTIRQNSHVGPNFGLSFMYKCEKYFKAICSLRMELNYSQLGWKEDIIGDDEQPLPDTYSRSMNYIQLPVLAHLAFGKEYRGLMFFVVAGPQIGYCFGESSKRSATWTVNEEGNPDRPNGVYQQYDLDIQNKFDYGITGGLGVELNTSIGHFLLEGRYYYGLGDVFDNAKKDPFSKSNHGTITAKLSYLIDISQLR